MLIRTEHDDDSPARPPIPTQVVSNGEYYPLPKTRAQRQVDERLTEYADRFGRKLGLSRRAFLRSACGMAAAMVAMNDVFGAHSRWRGLKFFPGVTPAAAADPDTAAALLDTADDFIFDVQTHHVDVDGAWKARNPAAVRFFACLRSPACNDASFQLLSQQNFIKEVFMDSNTSVALLSGVPTRDERDSSLPPAAMAATRDLVNAMAGTQRMLSHGLVRPNLSKHRNLLEMVHQVDRLKIASWKAYTGATLGRGGWWLDNERIAYPMYALSLQLGIRNFCVHKGLPLGVFDDTYVRARDVAKAARDWPGINFIIYHSAYPYEDEFIAQRALIPTATNVYCELGSTFAQTVISNPTRTAHVLGKLAKTWGTDHLVWGTDSIWWGSPAWQIAAFKQFQIPAAIAEANGYPQLTLADKRNILGLTSARLYGIDAAAARTGFADDRLAQLKAEYRSTPAPSNETYGPADTAAAFRLMMGEVPTV